MNFAITIGKALLTTAGVTCIALSMTSPARAAALSAQANLSGDSFLQAGSILNTSDAGLSITRVTYSLGTPENGVATWDSNVGGGTASEFLSSPRWFQTVTWSGLSILPGASFNFAGLDIDFISSLAPLSINEQFIDNVGTSLRNAFISVEFDNGGIATGALLQQGWTENQSFNLTGTEIPTPALLPGLIGMGIAALRKRTKGDAALQEV